MYEEKYETLLDLVKQKKDSAMHYSLTALKFGNRVFLLETIFLQAANQHDDKEACEYWEFLQRCLYDIELLQFTKDVCSRLILPSTDEVREAKSLAQANCAAKAKELWQKIPRSRIEKEYYHHIGKNVEEKHPTLIETKKVLLSEIATRWRDTKNEQEADELFDFLISIKPEYEEEKPLLDVVRKVTDSYFPSKRLFHCLARLISSPTPGHEFKKILAIAWARNMDFKELAIIAKAVEPLFGASDRAFDLLERQANKVATLDQAVSKLLESMNGQVRIEGLDQIFGEKSVSYPDENHVEIVIIDKKESSRSFNENAGHSSFEAARKHVDYWLKEHSGYLIHLKFMVVYNYNPKICFFSREQTFQKR